MKTAHYSKGRLFCGRVSSEQKGLFKKEETMNKLLNNLSVKAKIMGNSIFLLVVIAFISFYANQNMRKIGNELEAIAEVYVPLTQRITSITEHQLVQTIHVERVLRLAHMQNQVSKIEEAINQFDLLSKKVNEEIKHAESIAKNGIEFGHNQQEIKEFTKVNAQLHKIEKAHSDFEHHSYNIFALIKKDDTDAVDGLSGLLEQEEDQLNHELASLLAQIGNFTQGAAMLAEEHEHKTEFMLMIMAFIALVFGLSTSLLLSNRIISDIKSATKIASGDLGDAIAVKSDDEIGELLHAMNGMRAKLLNMVSEISGTTEQLSTAAEQISVITTQTSANIQQQQSETEQVATAMTEMNATVVEVSANVTNTAEAAKSANVETEKGLRVVTDAVSGIRELAKKVENASLVISQVEQDSENINTVLDVIKGIADQTNLLALNAAIEAARAGEQGRGFAVVADEVRTLAGRTQESTAEINDIIEKLQAGSRKAAEAMRESQDQSNQVVEKAELASHSLSAIATAVSKIDQMSSQIALSAEEQISVSDEMHKNITHISEMANMNTVGARQTSEAGAELASMASNLQGLVAQFRT